MKEANRPKTTTQPKGDPQASAPRSRVLTKADGKTSRRADALFKVLSTDYLLREQFVTDPAQIMSDYLFGERLTEEASDAANQMLFAVMSSPRLRNWMGAYSKHLRGAMPTRHEFAVDFARAVAASGDGLTSLALIRGASDARDHFIVQADLLRALIAVMGGRFSSGGTEMSPGGTEISPGGGTEMSPGAIFSGTEMSPGGGTEMSPGGTEMSPGAIFSGTEMSPGGGTEMSPGAIGSSRLPGYLVLTLSALVRYSGQLRARGALLSSGLEQR